MRAAAAAAAVANRKVSSGCPGRGIKTCQHDLYINVYGIYAVHKHTPIHTPTHTYTYVHPSIRNAYVCIFLCSHRNSFRVRCVRECSYVCVRDLIYRNLPYILQFSGYNSFCRFWPCAYLECGIKIYTDSLSHGTPESSFNTHEDLCSKDAL